MKKFTIITLGCKVNQYESDALARQLEASGYTQAKDGTPADLVIINTCTVTGKASMQARQAIRRAVRSFPAARIIATGCYAQTAPVEIEKIPGVHDIIGHADKHRIPELVRSSETDTPFRPVRICRDVSRERHFHAGKPPVFGHRTRPFLKIQDGCNAFCTYCIVPYARGRSRSMIPDTVLDHLGRLGSAGFHEVVLTGIHLGAYGIDLDPETNLSALLDRIADSRPVPRIRLSSIEPHEISEDIIHRVATSDIFCRHFHIPLQSGDDHILDRMHRPYSGRFFKELVRDILYRIPDAAIGVDILVGFPGETDEAFLQTYSLIEKLPITYLHVFPFSPRPGTPAARFSDQVPVDIIKDRCQRMRRLGKEKKRQFYRKFLGKKLNILVEDQRDPSSGRLKGFSSNYIPVQITGEDRLKNNLVTVRIKQLQNDGTVLGTLCDVYAGPVDPFRVLRPSRF